MPSCYRCLIGVAFAAVPRLQPAPCAAMARFPNLTAMTPITPRRTAAIAALVATAVGAGLVATAGATTRTTRTCHGLPVTISATGGAITGTPGRDVIALTGPGTVRAGGGNDVICGSPGNDLLEGGAGDDVIVGRAGRDRLAGDAGRDRLYGEQGNDVLVGGPGADVLMGGSGRDTIRRGAHTGTGAHEQQTGDQVVAGTDAISLALAPQPTRTFLTNDLIISWNVADPDRPMATQVIGHDRTYRPPGSSVMLSFPGTQGAFLAPYDDTACLQPQGTPVVPTSQVTFPTGQLGEMPTSPTLVGAATDVLWAAVVQPLLAPVAPACAGFTRDLEVDGASRGAQPLDIRMIMMGADTQFTMAPPTQLTLAVVPVWAMPPGARAQWMHTPLLRDAQTTTVDFSGSGEVVALSYSGQAGFTQD